MIQRVQIVGSFNQNQILSSTETGLSSIRNSKESNNSCGNNQSFLGDKKKPQKIYANNERENDLELQIKDSLKQLSGQYYNNLNDNKYSLFNYYCTPFLYSNLYNEKDNNFINKYE